MPPQPPKGNRPSRPSQPPAPGPRRGPAPPPGGRPVAMDPGVLPPSGSADVGLGVAVAAGGEGGVVTARRAGGLRDMVLPVDPDAVGIPAALQNLAKAINIAFQADFGENYLEAVYQAAIVRRGEVHLVHKEYFGFPDTWFGQFGMLLKSMGLTLQGPDPVSPEGQALIRQRGPSSVRGLLSLVGRKLNLVAEYEDRVPAYTEQMLDRLEASGIIVGWDRDDWDITTTRIGLNVRLIPRRGEMEQEVPGEG